MGVGFLNLFSDKRAHLIKKTFINGLFLIIPIILALYIIIRVIEILRKLVSPIASKISISLMGGEMTARILAIVLLILLCFFAGILAKTKMANQIKEWIEGSLLSHIPGYNFLKEWEGTQLGWRLRN